MTLFRSLSADAVVEMAGLAYAAYAYGPEPLDGQLAANAPGWTALRSDQLGLDADDFDADGYYDRNGAAGFVAVNGERLAIVFRGSDSIEDLRTVAFDQKDYFDDLKPLTQAALDYAAAQPEITTIELTGHSLGAAMVQRTAAKIDRFEVPDGIAWQMTTFGSAGTDVDNKTSFSRQILNFEHTGDPVPDAPLLNFLTQHGPFVTIDLPNARDAGTLAELARQKETQDDDPTIVTEHDMLRYKLSLQALAGSPLLSSTTEATVAVILDAADGGFRADGYTIGARNRFVLGLGDADTVVGSSRRDLIDGGQGDDVISAGSGDDVMAGGAGDDVLTGGGGADRFVFAGEFGDDLVTDFSRSQGDALEFRGFGETLDAFDELPWSVVNQSVVIDLHALNGGAVTLAGVNTLFASDVICTSLDLV
jgi:hypothetical protein